jgi:hypothetical protein
MITWLLAGLILLGTGIVIFKKIKKLKSGDFSCEGCKGTCSGCSMNATKEMKNKKDEIKE